MLIVVMKCWFYIYTHSHTHIHAHVECYYFPRTHSNKLQYPGNTFIEQFEWSCYVESQTYCTLLQWRWRCDDAFEEEENKLRQDTTRGYRPPIWVMVTSNDDFVALQLPWLTHTLLQSDELAVTCTLDTICMFVCTQCMHSRVLLTHESPATDVCVRVVLIFLATLQSSFTSSSVIKDAKLAKRREHYSHQSWNAPRTKETRQPCRRARDHGYTGLFVNVPYIDACFVVLLVPSIHT